MWCSEGPPSLGVTNPFPLGLAGSMVAIDPDPFADERTDDVVALEVGLQPLGQGCLADNFRHTRLHRNDVGDVIGKDTRRIPSIEGLLLVDHAKFRFGLGLRRVADGEGASPINDRY
jgi:hypothetical protein